MKYLCNIGLCLFILIGINQGFSQCPVGNVILNTQDQIDEFIIDFPNCNQLNGSLRIEGADITNLDGLINLTELNGGVLMINNNDLISLNGLNNVERVVGGLTIIDNELLLNFEGLNSLNHIGGMFQLEANTNLENFSGLELIDSITGQLFIYNNPALESLDQLENLSFIGGNLIITLSPFLTHCSIEAICNYIDNPNGVMVFSTNGSGCNSEQEVQDGCEDCIVMNVWEGPSGAHWHESEYWSLSIVPDECHEVLIPADSNMKVLAGMTATAYSLIIESGAIFETQSTAILDVVVNTN